MSKRPLRWLCALFALVIGSQALADEAVPIGEILAHPESYHLRIIPVQGTVRRVEVLKPHELSQPDDPSCYGAYVFELEDGTGSLEFGVLGRSGTCKMPIEGESPDVAIGDKVLVQAQIHAPGHYTEKWRSPIPIDRTTTQAIAVKITHLSGNSSQGRIDFETYRMLSAGMTKAEVLTSAGQPAQLYYGTCEDAQRIRGPGTWECWTYYYDGWTARLTLESGRVVKIESFKRP